MNNSIENTKLTKHSGIDWIGDIPSHWEVLRLKDVYFYKNRYAFLEYDMSNEFNGNYLIKITNLTKDGIFEDKEYCVKLNKNIKKFKIENNSILYALSGATAEKSCYLKETKKNFFKSTCSTNTNEKRK